MREPFLLLLAKVQRRSQPVGVSSLSDRRAVADLKTRISSTVFRFLET